MKPNDLHLDEVSLPSTPRRRSSLRYDCAYFDGKLVTHGEIEIERGELKPVRCNCKTQKRRNVEAAKRLTKMVEEWKNP